ncbi:MAG TPA: antibiotic biosynthesis monooxygenase [Actinomycetales bacterium]|nr:antibiotic biosynthesis monooxygenase [Actinomycetales bacterium]
MYARSTTIMARPDTIDAGIAHIRDEVMPSLMAMDGCIGLSMMCDQESGRCIATSAWRTEEAMRASTEQVRALRDNAADMMGGKADVEEWEIAVLHRSQQWTEGNCVRATWMRVDPADAERGIDIFKMASLPAMDQLDGFCSASLLVDRATGRACTSVSFSDAGAMERSRETANAMRERGMTEAKAEMLDEGEFELVLAHLHVPEHV